MQAVKMNFLLIREDEFSHLGKVQGRAVPAPHRKELVDVV